MNSVKRQKYNRWNPVPKELEKEVIAFYLAGNSTFLCDKKFGVSSPKILKRNGIKSRSRQEAFKSKTRGREQEIIADYKSGISVPKLQKKYGVGHTRLYNILDVHNVERRSLKGLRYACVGKEKEIIETYNSGLSALDTGKRFGICESTVLYIIREAGEKVRRAGIQDITKSHLWKGGISKDKKYMRDKKNAYCVERRKNDPLYKLTHTLRSRILTALKRKSIKKSSKTYEILGADWATVKTHIESKFRIGMSWENHGYGVDKWHVDHIVPLAAAKDDNELISLMHYKNLQPLWQQENQSKGGRLCL